VRDALAVGATIVATHTGGVLVVGLLLSTSTALVGERVLGWLGTASGALVVAVGAGMLVAARRGHRHTRDHHHGHDHHGHDHHDHDHDHDHGHHHHHHHGRRGAGSGRLGLAGIGLAGGLVPSPSALVVLLGAIGLGRATFGVVLVLAYGLGMAATLTGAGLLLLLAGTGLARRAAEGRLAGPLAAAVRLGSRWPAAASRLTGLLVVVVGVGIGLRAALTVV
jgi:ABC-type nickel/cobalt efflux system permease component RcnA